MVYSRLVLERCFLLGKTVSLAFSMSLEDVSTETRSICASSWASSFANSSGPTAETDRKSSAATPVRQNLLVIHGILVEASAGSNLCKGEHQPDLEDRDHG
jgi:hypothetical protein